MVVFWIKAEKKAESADHPKNEHGKSKLVVCHMKDIYPNDV